MDVVSPLGTRSAGLCMRSRACERMQPIYVGIHTIVCADTRPCAQAGVLWTQTHRRAARDATGYAASVLCSQTRSCVPGLDGLLARSPPCSSFSACAPEFCAVIEDCRLCLGIPGCARVHRRLFGNIGICWGASMRCLKLWPSYWVQPFQKVRITLNVHSAAGSVSV
jgi:hypothetical protein